MFSFEFFEMFETYFVNLKLVLLHPVLVMRKKLILYNLIEIFCNMKYC